jgi:tetratricopeptide (TPR) repeat protein
MTDNTIQRMVARLQQELQAPPAVAALPPRPVRPQPPLRKTPPDFCLCMIVRDEAPVIRRCLDSVIHMTDCYVICDTGSVDNTMEIIEDYFQESEHPRPGHLYQREWHNFGENKSHVLATAHTQAKAMGARYLFWLDADEVYQTAAGQPLQPQDVTRLLTKLDALPQDVGIVYFMTHFGKSRYQRWQLVRNNQLFQWRMPVHEYLEATVKGTKMRLLDDIVVLARKQGNSSRPASSRKLDDVRMFQEFLAQPGISESDRCRATFYLGQSHMEAGQLDQCLEVYQQRLQLGGWNQERFICMLRMARIYRKRGESDQALAVLLPALREFPGRLEGWLEVLLIYRQKKDWVTAFHTVADAPLQQQPNSGMLFYEEDVFRYRFLLEASVTAFYAGQYETAVWWASKIPVAQCPEQIQTTLSGNMKFFLGKRRLSNGVPDIVVVDNFLEDPDAMREFALRQPFEVKGNYPGCRTVSFATESIKKQLETLLGRPIQGWQTRGYNGAYQLTLASQKSWIHRDCTDYAGVLYLTPHAPLDGGTTFYRHRQLGVELQNATNQAILDKDSSNLSKWDVVDRVGNRYNRLVLFNGRRSHMSGVYFGDSPSTGRLFQTFFFNMAPRE